MDYERRTFARRASRARERGGDDRGATSALARRVSERSSRVITDESLDERARARAFDGLESETNEGTRMG